MLVIFLTALTRAVVDVPTVRLVNGVAPGSVVLMPVMAGGTSGLKGLVWPASLPTASAPCLACMCSPRRPPFPTGRD